MTDEQHNKILAAFQDAEWVYTAYDNWAGPDGGFFSAYIRGRRFAITVPADTFASFVMYVFRKILRLRPANRVYATSAVLQTRFLVPRSFLDKLIREEKQRVSDNLDDCFENFTQEGE